MDDKELERLVAELKDGKRFESLDLSGRDLSYQSLPGIILRGAALRKTAFLKSDLSGADLSGADLSGAFLISASLRKARMEMAKLKGADLHSANLSGARLAGADLEKANLERANLQGADLFRANLRDANLRQSNLLGAVMTEAQLYGANLAGATRSEQETSGVKIYDILSNASNRMMSFYDTTSSTILYVAGGLVCGIMGGIVGTYGASMAGEYWVVPASFVLGAVIGVAVMFGFDYFSQQAARALTRRHKMEETYSEMFYKRDIIHANYLFREGRYEEALKEFKQIFSKAPDRVEPRFKIASINLILGDPERARAAYDDIVDLFADTLGEDNMYIMESRRALKELGGEKGT